MLSHESAKFSPFGDDGFTLRACPLRVRLRYAVRKTKASLTTFAHTKAFVMSVCSHALAQKTKTQKTKPCTKACFMWLAPHVLPPPGPVPLGLTLHRALKQRVPNTKACFMIEHAHCVRTKAFMVSLARWRLHKSVFYGNTS